MGVDKSKVIQYRGNETISCSIILFHFILLFSILFHLFRWFRRGSRKGGPRFVYNHLSMPIDQFQSVFLLLISETMQLHTNNPVNEFKSQTFVRTASAYTYMLERVGYQHFFNANQ